jgi:hypothetical protein
MNLQNCGTHDLRISKFKVLLGNWRHFSRFNVTFTINQEIYYYEIGDRLVLSASLVQSKFMTQSWFQLQ